MATITDGSSIPLDNENIVNQEEEGRDIHQSNQSSYKKCTFKVAQKLARSFISIFWIKF